MPALTICISQHMSLSSGRVVGLGVSARRAIAALGHLGALRVRARGPYIVGQLKYGFLQKNYCGAQTANVENVVMC